MNFFFQLSGRGLSSAVQVPCFRNDGRSKSAALQLYGAVVTGGKWRFRDLEEFRSDSFYEVDGSNAPEDEIYFYADRSGFAEVVREGKLLPTEKFTQTSPNFRANLCVRNEMGAFSSYQAEYPYGMTLRKGCIVSEPGLLVEESCIRAGVFLRNIFHLPVNEKRVCYLLDEIGDRVVRTFYVYNNQSNFIDLTQYIPRLKDYIICLPDMLCAPIYVVENADHSLSFEHTHPPSAYIGRRNHSEIISNFKQRYVDIIDKASS